MRTIALTLIFILISVRCTGQHKAPPENNLQLKREQMVKRQIAARGITNTKVLSAMRKVERHLFVPEDKIDDAYGDYAVPIGYGQTISQPYIVAFMTDILDVKRDTKVLEVGTGSGYQAAVMGEICDSVFTIEIIKPLAEKSRELLKKLGYRNVFVKIGDGYKGWPEYAPYDAIIVTCSPSHIPEPLVEQLAEGGKMVIPVGKLFNQELVLLVKNKGKLKQQAILPVRFVPMVNEENQEY